MRPLDDLEFRVRVEPFLKHRAEVFDRYACAALASACPAAALDARVSCMLTMRAERLAALEREIREQEERPRPPSGLDLHAIIVELDTLKVAITGLYDRGRGGVETEEAWRDCLRILAHARFSLFGARR